MTIWTVVTKNISSIFVDMLGMAEGYMAYKRVFILKLVYIRDDENAFFRYEL